MSSEEIRLPTAYPSATVGLGRCGGSGPGSPVLVAEGLVMNSAEITRPRCAIPRAIRRCKAMSQWLGYVLGREGAP